VKSATEISNKFQKTRFWKEKSVENVVTLGPKAQATLVHIWGGVDLSSVMMLVCRETLPDVIWELSS
jgi:hypothetical protein